MVEWPIAWSIALLSIFHQFSPNTWFVLSMLFFYSSFYFLQSIYIQPFNHLIYTHLYNQSHFFLMLYLRLKRDGRSVTIKNHKSLYTYTITMYIVFFILFKLISILSLIIYTHPRGILFKIFTTFSIIKVFHIMVVFLIFKFTWNSYT